MLAKLLKGLFTTRYGAYVLVALAVVAAAAVAKVYYSEVAAPEAERAATGVEGYLDTVGASLTAYRDARKEGEAELPGDAPWTPATVECGSSATIAPAEAAHPTWKALALPTKAPTRYQYRFRARESAWHLMARTDSDCDGVYKVFHLRGTTGWEGIGTQPLKIDNPGE